MRQLPNGEVGTPRPTSRYDSGSSKLLELPPAAEEQHCGSAKTCQSEGGGFGNEFYLNCSARTGKSNIIHVERSNRPGAAGLVPKWWVSDAGPHRESKFCRCAIGLKAIGETGED